MKIALIIPTRGDRPKFLKQCHKLIAKQTLQPTEVIVVDYAAKSGLKDITARYRKGVEKATKRGCDCAVFWEDDDWYHPTYLEWLVKEWTKHRRPQVFGVGETYYYNIAATARLYMNHPNRTSAFCTLINLPYRGSWPDDHYAYLDMHFHKLGIVKTVTFPKNKILAIGIKHGIGLTGGGGHHARFRWDATGDEARKWFVKHMDEEVAFYDYIAKIIPSQEARVIQPNRRGHVRPTTKNLSKNGKRTVQKKVTVTGTRTQLHRRGRKIIKVRRK